MKKLLTVITLLFATAALSFGDVFIGYDGDCQVYFTPGYGYFESCDYGYPIFLGLNFDGIRFRHGFRGDRFHEGFRGDRGGFNGGFHGGRGGSFHGGHSGGHGHGR